jgi:hypothetical protein
MLAALAPQPQAALEPPNEPAKGKKSVRTQGVERQF